MDALFHVTRQALSTDACRVVVFGEIDMATAGTLVDSVSEAIADPAVRTVTLDLDHVGFLDAAGIQALVDARHFADERATALHVTNCHGIVRRVMDIVEVWNWLSAADAA
jgi:anti-anti-sigma factor